MSKKETVVPTVKTVLETKGIAGYNMVRGAVIRAVPNVDGKDKDALKAAIGEAQRLLGEVAASGADTASILIDDLLSGKATAAPAKTSKKVAKKAAKKKAATKKAPAKKQSNLGAGVLLSPTGSVKLSLLKQEKHGEKVLHAHLSDIVPAAEHPRFDMGDMKSYERFLLENWEEFQRVMQPIVVVARVTKGVEALHVYDGMRTLRALHGAASKAAGKIPKDPWVPALVAWVDTRPYVDGEPQPLPVEVAAYIQRLVSYRAAAKHHHPAELAHILHTSVESAGMPLKEAAGYLGLTQARARELLLLMAASPKVSEAVAQGQVQLSDLPELMKGCKGKHSEQDARLALQLNPEPQASADGKLPIRRVSSVAKQRSGTKRVKLNKSITEGGAISEKKARQVLSSIASTYNNFRRGGLGRHQENEAWDALDSLLMQVRNLKAQGRIIV